MIKNLCIFIGLIVLFSDLLLAKTQKNNAKNNFEVISSTRFDFSEATIIGEMKAPEGFYLQGRQPQSLSQMVKLRSNFKNQLRNSKSAVKALSN